VADEASRKTELIVRAADKLKALDLRVLHVAPLTIVCDCFVICHGRSLIHVDAIADGIEELGGESGLDPLRRDRRADAKWIVLDYGDVIVHVFTEQARRFYNLEGLWSEAESVPLARFLPDLAPEADPQGVADDPGDDPPG
jgi:ribosome-associated protein